MTRAGRLVLTDAAGLAPYVPGLRALERDIAYPIADGADQFRIDHGADYHPFFSAMGDARFLLALDARTGAVVGTLAGVLRTALDGPRGRVPSAYLCDLKLARSHRGGGLARRMALRALAAVAEDPALRRWRVAYGAAMRGARGDVMRSARGLHPARLMAPAARLAVYFVPAARLASLDVTYAPPAPPLARGLDLSPDVDAQCAVPGTMSTAGRKDLRLASAGDAPWPLVHLPLGPRAWRPSWGAYLRACGVALCEATASASAGARAPSTEPPTACFAIDERLAYQTQWLASHGVVPGAACTVYTLRVPPLPLAPAREWVHLATSEI